MKSSFSRILCLLIWLGGAVGPAFAQGCAVTMTKSYSTYHSASTDGTHIFTSALVDGSATCTPSPGCPCGSATHTPKALNKIGSVGGWGSGTPQCVSCYLSEQNNQSIVATPGVVYTFQSEGQIICSLAGTLFDSGLTSQKVQIPNITGPFNVWWFNGQNPSGYATSITLNSTAGSTTKWSVASGASMITLSSSTGASVTVTSTGNAFSSGFTDIGLVATDTTTGLSSKTFNITSRRPYLLVAGTIVYKCDATYGYVDDFFYTIQDQLQTSLPYAVPFNENWTSGVFSDYTNNNWRRGVPNGGTTDPTNPAAFTDSIGGENIALPPHPPTACPGAGQAVQHWDQEYRIGNKTPGVGQRVQTDTIQKYTNHAEQQLIKSPNP